MTVPPQVMTVGDVLLMLGKYKPEHPVYLVVDPPEDAASVWAETVVAPVQRASLVRDRLWFQVDAEVMVQLIGTVPNEW